MTVTHCFRGNSRPGVEEPAPRQRVFPELLVSMLADTAGDKLEAVAKACQIRLDRVEPIMHEAGYARCPSCGFWLRWPDEFPPGKPVRRAGRCTDCRQPAKGPPDGG